MEETEGFKFQPFGEYLPFPICWGAIAELVALIERGGKSNAPYTDAASIFFSVPPGVQLDGTFRQIVRKVKEATRLATESELRDLPEVLSKLYMATCQELSVWVPLRQHLGQ